MADANLRPSRRVPCPASARATLRDSPDYHGASPFIPWMQIADIWLERTGFSPGQPVRISFDYRNSSLTITPEYE